MATTETDSLMCTVESLTSQLGCLSKAFSYPSTSDTERNADENNSEFFRNSDNLPDQFMLQRTALDLPPPKLMDHNQQPPPEYPAKSNVYIHLIRHAQAQHNYTASTTTKAERAHYRSIHDPSLTPLGQNQALHLRSRFPYMHLVTHILTSPLRRTLQTCLLAFAPLINDAGMHPIAIPELRETGRGPNSTGSHLPSLLAELAPLGGLQVLIDGISRDWAISTEQKHQAKDRASLVLSALADLGDVARGLKRDWMGHNVPCVEEGRDVHMVVVSHGNFIGKMTQEKPRDEFYNAEFRTYVFKGGEGVRSDRWELVETAESLDRPHELFAESEEQEKGDVVKESRDGDEAAWVEKDMGIHTGQAMTGEQVDQTTNVQSVVDIKTVIDPRLIEIS